MMNKKVVVYSSDTCPYCVSAKEYLKENNIEFVEKNVSKDPQARNELIEKKQMGVPVIMVDEEMIVGFDKNKLDNALGL